MSYSEDFEGAIGIDLGNSVCCVGVWKKGKDSPEIIPNEFGRIFTRSYVSFNNRGILVGDSAYDQLSINPSNTIFNIKQMLGMKFNTLAPKQAEKWFGFPFKILEINGKFCIEVEMIGNKKHFYPEVICAMLLSYLKTQAERYLNKNVNKCVIAVPALFNDSQRQAMKDASYISGMNCLRLCPEPTLAATIFWNDYLKQNHPIGERRVIIIDIGWVKLDVCLFSIEEGVIEVVGINGDQNLGGMDFVERIVEQCCFKFIIKKKITLKSDVLALNRLRMACEKGMVELSSSRCTKIEVTSEGKILSESIKRGKFGHLNTDLFSRIIFENLSPLFQYKPFLKGDEVDDILFMGGPSRIPFIQRRLREYFERDLCEKIDHKKSITLGAATFGGYLTTKGEKKEIIEMNSTPRSIGIKRAGGMGMAKLFDRNQIIKCKISEIFTTSSNNQSDIVFDVVEGEKGVDILGTFHISGIPPAPRGVSKIEINFCIDDDGILQSRIINDVGGKLSLSVDKGRLSRVELEEFRRKERCRMKYSSYQDLLDRRLYLEDNLESIFFSDEEIINKYVFCVDFINGKKIFILRSLIM